MGCRIVIPRSCVIECAKHASISNHTFNYFGNSLLSLPAEFVEQHVWNVFVKGFYYYRIFNKESTKSYFDYQADYYESENEYGFMLDVIKQKLSEKIEVIEQKNLVDKKIEPKDIEKLGDKIFEIMKDTKKAKYRTEEDMKEIAYLDAELYLLALQLNNDVTSNKGGILSQNAYIISESSRYTKAISGIKGYKNIVIRSYSIYSLLRMIGTVKKPRDEMDTLADPLLSKIVIDMWEDVEKMIKNGIRLDNMGLTRLRWDFDKNVHERLLRIDVEDIKNDTTPTESEDDYIALIKSFKAKGYSLAPEAEKLVYIIGEDKEAILKLQQENSEKDRIIEELLKASSDFGKRKQRYLKRILNS